MNKQEFENIIRSNSFMELRILDNIRQKKFKKISVIFYILVVLLIFSLIKLMQNYHLGLIFMFLWLMIFVSVIGPLLVYKKEYSMNLKTNFLSKVLKVFGEIEFCPNKKLDLENNLIESGLFSRNESFCFDDKFLGEYNNVKFEILESLNFKKQLILGFNLNKHSENRTIIVPKRALFQRNSDIFYFWLPIIVFILIITLSVQKYNAINLLEYLLFVGLFVVLFITVYFVKNKSYNLEALNKISLEDINFDKKYNVYSSDEVEARYLVTSALMERILNLKTVFKGKMVRCSFYKDRLIIVIETKKDVFELGNLFCSLLDLKTIDQFYMELSSVLSIIDYLRLNEKTGL